MEFIYTGIDIKSVKSKGKLAAKSQKEVIDYLRGNNITPLSIRQVKGSRDFLFFKAVKNSDIVLFTRQLSSMILTGLTLIEALKILQQQKLNPAMNELITDLIAQISEGNSLSMALETHKEYFSDVYIALIKAAEKGGLLDKVLSRLADNLERSEDLNKKIKSAMFYPSIVIVAMGGVLLVMNLFVIPQLGALYKDLNLTLPLPTLIVLGISNAISTLWPLGLIGGVIAAVLYNRFKKTPEGHKVIDKIKLKIPIVGGILILTTLDEISRTLSLLISSGASIIESLDITAKVAGNYWYETAMKSSSELVEKGIPLSDALDHQKLFPPMLIQMTKVGESTGKIDESLYKISEYFERDLDIRIKTLTTAIEPILIIFLGVSVAFLTISVITPIYGLLTQIQ